MHPAISIGRRQAPGSHNVKYSGHRGIKGEQSGVHMLRSIPRVDLLHCMYGIYWRESASPFIVCPRVSTEGRGAKHIIVVGLVGSGRASICPP